MQFPGIYHPSPQPATIIQLDPDPTTGSARTGALLNGLEVFKFSHNRNLAYVETYDNVKEKKNNIGLLGIGEGIASIVIVATTCLIIFCFWKKKKEEIDTNKSPPGWRPLNPNKQNGTIRPGRHFTIAENRATMNNFNGSLVIGVGEFDGSTLAAIKRSNPQSQQGLNEFETEIELLSKLRHSHLVSLIGFCNELDEMILVYEYMSNDTMMSHISGSDLPPLSWKQQLEIYLSSVRGLHYLPTGLDRGIIYKDVKTTNILLDGSLMVKMSEFGLPKTGPSLEHTLESTAVKGTFGYLNPDEFRRQHLTEKSDVQSIGVVLLGVVCARAVINPTLPRDQINLAEWAMLW
ncbi:hercules receptor kinase 2 [Perilla frutescens var. hirtella]|nr:hercules receptor kinase 2 [Perilla frutescens var. hirtella]